VGATTYAYKVRDPSGSILEGQLEADNEQLVVAKLREMGYVPVSVSRKSRSLLGADFKLFGAKVSLKDVAVFSRQLATMINAGLSILRALAILADQAPSKALAAVVVEMKEDIERGLSLSQSIAKHPKIFPPIYLSMIRAGETGGSLDGVLERLADTMEKQLELRGKIRSAMAYPVAVACLVVLIVTGMLLFVVPMFQGMYKSLGGVLPLPTRVLIKLSNTMKTLWWLLALIFGGGFFGLRRWGATEKGRRVLDQVKLRVPIFGPLIHKTSIARVTRTFASLMRSGVPIMETLDIVAGTAGNAVISDAVSESSQKVRVGEPVSTALGAHSVFPGLVVQMMAVGEETGALDEMLQKIADFYEREVSATVDALTSLIEPLLMVFMGAAVGGMIISLYMPMFQIIKLVK
jgi:type IV pilus assembly protein PilC